MDGRIWNNVQYIYENVVGRAINKPGFVAQKAKHVQAIMQYTITRRLPLTCPSHKHIMCMCVCFIYTMYIVVRIFNATLNQRRFCTASHTNVENAARACFTWSFRYSPTKYCLKHDCIRNNSSSSSNAPSLMLACVCVSILFFCQQTLVAYTYLCAMCASYTCSRVCTELFVVCARTLLTLACPLLHQSILMAFTLSKFGKFYQFIAE